MEAISLKAAIDAIRNDFDNGSSTIAKNAIDVFAMAVSVYEDKDQIIETGKLLLKAKPAMAALQNIVNMCIERINDMEHPNSFSEEAKELKTYMDNATTKVVDKAIEYMNKSKKNKSKYDTVRIITASYSSTVIELFKELYKRSIPVRIYAMESKWHGRDYAESIIKSCKEIGIECNYITQNEAIENINNLDFAISGADSFQNDGSVVNGIPSLYLAKISKDKIPYLVLAESYKKADKVIIEDGFELVPSKYISEIITD